MPRGNCQTHRGMSILITKRITANFEVSVKRKANETINETNNGNPGGFCKTKSKETNSGNLGGFCKTKTKRITKRVTETLGVTVKRKANETKRITKRITKRKIRASALPVGSGH